jgi:hypothetical protein
MALESFLLCYENLENVKETRGVVGSLKFVFPFYFIFWTLIPIVASEYMHYNSKKSI